MSTLGFIGIILAGYIAGLFGSVLGMVHGKGSTTKDPKNQAIILVWIFVVLSYWPIQIAKVAVAVGVALWLAGGSFVLLKACAICFLSGFVLMKALPAIGKAYRHLKDRSKG